jgi:hypothetical protein
LAKLFWANRLKNSFALNRLAFKPVSQEFLDATLRAKNFCEPNFSKNKNDAARLKIFANSFSR